MAARIRTLNFLPEVFQTVTNAQFLSATLDQIVDQPNTMPIEGYVGSKFGYGINAKDNYVVEPTKTRTDYQLDPGVVFTKTNTSLATDFVTYPGIVDGITYQGGLAQNNDRLFNSQIYSWDPFVDLDKLINFNQYYWLPEGAPSVNISAGIIYTSTSYTVDDTSNGYNISSDVNPTGTTNPTLTLIRGGTYTFAVNQSSSFWIQGKPGVTGLDPQQLDIQTRDVLGVDNNGATSGTVTFNVPYTDSQSEYNFPGNIEIDVVAAVPYNQVNGVLLSTLIDIDGVTSLNGLTVLFYGQTPGEDGNPLDISSNIYIIEYTGSESDPTIQLNSYGTLPNEQKITINYGVQWRARNFYRNIQGTITLIPYLSSILDTLYYQDGSIADKVGIIKLVDSNYTNQINVVRDILGKTTYNTGPNGIVFTNGLKVTFSGDVVPTSYKSGEYYVQGVGSAIVLINTTNLIVPELFTAGSYSPFDVLPYDTDNWDSTLYIPLQQDYITIARDSIDRNPWSRSNRWFHIDVINATASYLNNPAIATIYATKNNKAKRPIIEFYPNLKLFNNAIVGKLPIDFLDTRTTDAFLQVAGQEIYYPDVEVYTEYTATINASPVTPAGSFIIGQQYEITTLGTTDFTLLGASSNTVGTIFTASSTGLTLAGSFVIGDSYTIVFVGNTDFVAIGAASNTIGVTFTATGIGSGNGTAFQGSGTATAQTYTTVEVAASDVTGTFAVDQFISDNLGVLPRNAQIYSISGSTTLVIVVYWTFATTIGASSNVSLIANTLSNDDYSIYDGAKIVFASDTNPEVRNKIYVSRLTSITGTSTPVITLTEVENGLVLPEEGVFAFKGYNNQGKDFYFDGTNWIEAQQKTTVNQPPLFDIVDYNNISLGNKVFYAGTSFTGSKLFAYGVGSGINDIVLGFPLKYSSITNVGDISFDVTFNSETFTYVNGTTPITENVNTGYVVNLVNTNGSVTYGKTLGWQTTVAPSTQYQILYFNYYADTPTTTFVCDVAALPLSETIWPNIQLFVNNDLQPSTDYTYIVSDTTTTVTFSVPNPAVDTVIQISIISDQVSEQGFYQVPVNLSNNPFNNDITTVDVGDIRRQYLSIFYNNPNTAGQVFGPNNYRDLGNLVPWGNSIIQNSASLVLPGTFLRQQSHNLFSSLEYNSQQYVIFKNLLVNTVNSTDYTYYQTPAVMLDEALDVITSTKVDTGPFFWSDMLPSKAPYTTNSYTFANSLDTSIYPLIQIYNYNTANYNGVLVYLTRNEIQTQLIINKDYVVSTDSPSLTVTYDLLAGDIITINEYNQTFGTYVPNTPTKLGLYPSWIPTVVLDSNYLQPTYFIVGHDGSYNKLYGDYIDGHLIDFRDKVLFEFETRIYNNLKLSDIIPIRDYDVIPGFFRTTDYSYDEIMEIYSQYFLNWVGQNRVEYKQQLYIANNEFTYNYNQSSNKLDGSVIQQGYWRGIYQYMYDTSQPDVAPWQMIGFTDQPSWWESRYGAAPYTSDNLILWGDLSAGINWNNGNPIIVQQCIRPGLLEVLPVDGDGNLVSPFYSVVSNFSQNTFKRDWKVGDVGPTEFSYRRSSSWPFDLMKILALTKPANFFNLGVDVDNYKYNPEFNQFLVNDRNHLIISDIQIYGSGIAKTSYINWIVDYEKQFGVDATETITNLLSNLDVRLIYRLAGFSDKTLLNFYVEKGTPNSNNASLLIPNESYSVLLYDNVPFTQIVFSGVIIQSTANGWKIFGNSQSNAFFKIVRPKINGNYSIVTVDKLSVQIAKDYSLDKVEIIPYGTEFYSAQDLSQFLNSYGTYLITQGVLFDQIESGLDVNWKQMIAEFLYWIQSGWETGSIVNLNPGANIISINKDSYIVQPLTLQKQNFILNQNLYPIQAVDLSVVRDGTLFTAKPLNEGDTVAYGQFNISNIENGIVFNNITLFNDIIYNLNTGLKQDRIFLRGVKTAEWNGTMDAQGFILNQDNIKEWSPTTKYTKGSIVLFKNQYWSALKVINPSIVFQPSNWKETNYNEIQKGMLPNSSTRSYESTLFYDTNKQNLDNDADLLSWSLIGYRPRDYLALADLTDITQVNVYKNMIKTKGTRVAANAFKGLTLPQGGIDYDIYETWAIKTGEFGGILNNNFVDFKLSEPLLTGNPAIVGLTNGYYTDGVEQEVQLYSLFNYGRPISDPNILPTVSSGIPSVLLSDAGYVNFNDVKTFSYYYDGLNTATVPITKLYVGEFLWLAEYLGTWQIYSPTSLGTVVFAVNNLNNTVTLRFAQPHNLTKYQPFGVINFNSVVDGYRIVSSVVDPYSVTIVLSLPSTITTITGLGIGIKFDSQRVASPNQINTLDLLNTEFVKNKVWVDVNSDSGWAVYQKSINYTYDSEITKINSVTFGNAVAYTDNIGYLIADAGLGEVYRYIYNPVFKRYDISQVLTGSVSFGSTIAYNNNLIIISQPTTSPEVTIYQLVNNQYINEIQLIQTISAPAGVTNWGSAVAVSGDTNWLYISAYEQNLVYVYRKSEITSLYQYSKSLTTLSLVSGDNFGYSITTNYYGDTVTISAPNKASSLTVSNYGYAYVFDRLVQTFEAPFASTPYVPLSTPLAFSPSTSTLGITATNSTTDKFTTTTTSSLSLGMPVVFTGTLFGGVSANTVYYILTIDSSTEFTITTTLGSIIPFQLTTASGTMSAVAQVEPIFVSVNGTDVGNSTYSVIGNTFNLYGSFAIGSIIVISGSYFVQSQQLSSNAPINEQCQFGYSLEFDNYGNELLIGSPFELQDGAEGNVYRYTNSGGKYGVVIGTSTCQITSNSVILINGYIVTLIPGDASSVAQQIISANINNVTASALNGILTISVKDSNVAYINDKLTVMVTDSNIWGQLGILPYTKTQVLSNPHPESRTQFGKVVKLNEYGSLVVSAPVGTRFEDTTFDMSDDINYTNDTLFDNNTTQFIDQSPNAGAVYMFDYLGVYIESITNTGSFVYAQSVNSLDLDYGYQPYYGTAIDFNSNNVIIGTPNFLPNSVRGQVIVYKNASGVQDWEVFRNSGLVADINSIQNTQIYSASTNNTLINLDYIDPLQGKLLGVVSQNIDVVATMDPASYNSPNTTSPGKLIWGAGQLGKLWFNTSKVKFVNYHQNDSVSYNSKWWGKVFPGSDVQVYSWITSDSLPIDYTGPGTPYDLDEYVIEFTQSSTGAITPIYFYWVRNTNIVFTKEGKTLSDSICESYIAQPQATGIAYLTPLEPNIFGLYNCGEYILQVDSVLHIGYATGFTDNIDHSVYSLIRANYADDFLPGLPGTTGVNVPISLYNRLLESLSGVDDSGSVVPDPFLPKAVQSGILVRPRQSFFYNRFNALKNFFEFVNALLITLPALEFNATFLFLVGPTNPSTGQPFYNVQDYWEFVTWWAPGYSDNTRAAILVDRFYQLAYVNAYEGMIATVAANPQGLEETYVYEAGIWVRIGLQYGTVQFKSSLWDYAAAGLGFGNNFFDTTPFDTYPSEETKWIVRGICEQLPSDLLIFRNKGLILLFEYIISETIETQNYIPWLNKTSFVDVSHTIRELLPLKVFQSDNQEFLSGYLNEIKPYHVVVKDFLFKYKGTDVYKANFTDFDLPATYNTAVEQYITPELVYSNPNNINEYLPTSSIWSIDTYSEWFNNFGVSLTGNKNYFIATLQSYMSLNINSMYVNNIYGFPINGIITIGQEQIGYSSVDIATNIISGLTRGVNGTVVAPHIPGELIYINLSPVIVLDAGRGYLEPPKVTAYIDTSIYPPPRRPAILQPVMNLDSLLRIDVVDPGDGYVVTPEIVVAPSIVVTFSSTDINLEQNTVYISNQLLQTGDLVQYTIGSDTTAIGGLFVGQYYYIAVLQTTPIYVISFYTTYADCIQNVHSVTLYDTGSGSNNIISVSARAIGITSSSPVRENQITLRFDRTTYTSQVVDWAPAGFYGSFFAGLFNNSTQIASSAIKLESTGNYSQAPVSLVLASSQGITFEIQDVANDQIINWSSRTRIVDSTSATNYSITISPSEGGLLETDYLGPTTGFYSTMPIKFAGVSFGGFIVNNEYYVSYIFDLNSFAISNDTATTNAGSFVNGTKYIIDSLGTTDFTSIGASSNTLGTIFTASGAGTGTGTAYSIVTLTTTTAPSSGVEAIVGEVLNTAIVTINYPNILTVTQTQSVTNIITVPLTTSGLGGTNGFYQGLPVYFVGTTFGNIFENDIYYIVSILGIQTFTMSKESTPMTLSVYSATSSVLVVDLTDDLNVNDPFVLTNITVAGTASNSFAGLSNTTIYYVQSIVTATTISVTTSINGAAISLTPVSAASDTLATFVNQRDVIQLSDATGSVTMNVGLPVSPGQITGQYFTLYETSGEFTNGGTGLTGTTSNLLERIVTAAEDTRLYITSASKGISQFYVNMPLQLSSSFAGLSAAPTTYYITALGFTTQTVTATSSITNRFTCTSTDGFYVGMPIEFTGLTFGDVLLNVIYFIKSVPTSTTFTICKIAGSTEFVPTTGTGSMTVTSKNPYISVASSVSGPAISLSSVTGGDVTLTQTPIGSAPRFYVSYLIGGYAVQINPSYIGQGFAYNNLITIGGSQLGGVDGVNDLVVSVSSIDSIGGILTTINSGTPAGTSEGYYLKVISENQCAVYSDITLSVPVSGIDFPFIGVVSTTVTIATASNDRFTVGDSTIFSLNDPIVFTGTVFGGVTVGQTYYIKSLPTTTTITISESINGTTFNIATNDSGSMTLAKSGDFAFLAEPFYFQQSIVKYQNKVWQCVVSNNDNEFILGKWQLLSSDDRRLNELDRITGYYQPTVNMPGLDISQLITGTTYPNATYFDNRFPPAEEFLYDTYLQDQPFYPVGVDAIAVAWNGVRFIGIANSSEYSALISSPNSLVWSIDKLANETVSLTDIAYGPGLDSSNLFVISSTNPSTPIYVSDDGGIRFTTGMNVVIPGNVYVESTSLEAVSSGFGKWVAVGENIVTSIDGYNWVETYPKVSNQVLLGVSSIQSRNFSGFVAVGYYQTTSASYGLILKSVNEGASWTQVTPDLTTTSFITTYSLNAITSGNNLLVIVGDNGVIFTSINGSNWDPQVSGISDNLNDIVYGNGKFIAVGDNGTIIVSTNNGVTWSDYSYTTTTTLNGITYNNTNNDYVIVGNNNLTLLSTDAITWNAIAIYTQLPTVYTVQGDEFTEGYGPEELVPGVVTDNLTMVITTRPGTNWDITEYGHSGFNVVSTEVTPNLGQTQFSFNNIVLNPAQIALFDIVSSTGLSNRIYDYSINWVTKVITLDSSLPSGHALRIDCYEVGDGNQLAKSNSQLTPLEKNVSTGFSEIILDCYYSASISNGSGLIRSGSIVTEIEATATFVTSNLIVCNNVNNFTLNSMIIFTGTVFGGVFTSTQYFVKTINPLTNSITISDVLINGIAGPAVPLSTATGLMTINIQIGNGLVWSDPIVIHNGTTLVLGQELVILQTVQSSSEILCTTTSALIVNQPIVFADGIFGGLSSGTVYYIKAIISSTAFTISSTPGGSTTVLSDGLGTIYAITNDFAIGLVNIGQRAKIIFATEYTTSDYIVYSVFGETEPNQYGFTLPIVQTQPISGTVYDLTGYLAGDNPGNAIVEIDGVRQPIGNYSINSGANTITFGSTPSGTTLAVTTYNLTDTQYLNTQTITGVTVSSIININNTISPALATTGVTAVNSATKYLTASNTSNFLLNATVQFYGNANLGNVDATTGTVYFIKSIDSSTTFTISTSPGGSVFDPGTAIGSIVAVVGGQPAVRVTTSSANLLSTNDIVRISGTSGSVQLNEQLFYVHVISSTQFDLYQTTYNPGAFVSNLPVTSITAYSGGGYVWKDQIFIISSQTATATNVNNKITVGSTSNLVVGTPIYFNCIGCELGYVTASNIIIGTKYFIHSITSSTEFTISTSHDGSIFDLTTQTGLLYTVSQWEQTIVDRLWVTVNGYRVASSSLRLYPNNDLGILTPISTGDSIIITSMIPTATPNQLTYIQNVNKSGSSVVYRANSNISTWLTKSLQYTDTIIHLDNVSNITSSTVITVSTPSPSSRVYTIGLPVDKNAISEVIIYNNDAGVTLPSSYYRITVVDTVPVVQIYNGVTVGQILTITVVLGNVIYIAGEAIRFSSVNFTTNTISGLQRGVNGTSTPALIPIDTRVYGILSPNQLLDEYYDMTWNSYNYNPVLGDPLQISTTAPANFLNTGTS